MHPQSMNVDTAGQEEYSSMRDQYIRSGQAFLLVFNLANMATLDTVVRIIHQILRMKDCERMNDLALVICANKCDLVSPREADAGVAHARQTIEAAFGANDVPIYITSAKTSETPPALLSLSLSHCPPALGSLFIIFSKVLKTFLFKYLFFYKYIFLYFI